jgi:hypothetical protein
MSDLNGVALPDDIYWEDEYDWTPITQILHTTLTGTVKIEQASMSVKRPMTLGGGSTLMDTSKGDVDALFALLSSTLGHEMTLDLRGATYSVVWRHEDGRPLEAKSLQEYADPDADDRFSIKLKLWIM